MKPSTPTNPAVSWWQPVLFAAMAGGLGWGIRGQYGHETGAMIAGLLVSLTLLFLLCPGVSTIQAIRAAALGTIAMGVGGTETYGVTLGLTHNPELVGNWSALRWGLLGCLVKGALWIGFAGLFFGLGLGGKRYRPLEILGLTLAMLAVSFLGSWLLNSPFDVEERRLPAIHFSNLWHWLPESDTRPRPEAWGGLLFALSLALAYVALWKKDALARNLGLWGLLGGALGFPIGQSLQAYHAWNPEVFQRGIWVHLDPHMNWWNTMETTFGCIMGAALGLGLWLNRRRIDLAPDPEERGLPAGLEWALLGVHAALLVYVQAAGGRFASFYDSGLVLIIIPLFVAVRGRIWPVFQILTITLLPITIKTVRNLVLEEEAIAPIAGWTLYLVLPLAAATALAAWYLARPRRAQAGGDFVAWALLLNLWLYFGLNFAFFRYPWPWSDWTGRTPSGIVFTIFTLSLTAMVLIYRDRAQSLPAPRK